MFLLQCVFLCVVAVSFADDTAKKLSFGGYFRIYGATGLSQGTNTTDDSIQIEITAITSLLQIKIDKVLDFVSWKLKLTGFNAVRSIDSDNDDQKGDELHFIVEAFLADEENENQYFSDIIDTLNDILVDELLSGISVDALRKAYIPAGSLTIEDGVTIHAGYSAPPSSSPVLAPEKLHLLMLGDWGKGGLNGDITATATSSMNFDKSRRLGKSGGTDYTYQAAVARSMMKYVRYINLRAVISLGDNFYSSGVTSTTDSLWTTIWRNVYLTENSPLNVPWYTVLGNHDYGSSANAEAQINRYKRHDTDDNNWIMPSHNYSKTFDIIGGGSAKVIFIDTATLAPSVNKCCNEKGGVSLAQQAFLIDSQLKFIESQLQQAVADPPTWLLVVGHYPVFSAGEHGDTAELKTYLLPLLEKYHVDAYFCGHDHISEHMERRGVQYFVAGAGALTDKIGTRPSEGNLVWAGAGYSAFAAIAATNETLMVSFVNIHGETVYSHTVQRLDEPGIDLESLSPVDEESANMIWILETLKVDNASQAAMKLSGITCVCVLLAVALIVALDANFVSRVKNSTDVNSIGNDASHEENNAMGEEEEEKVNCDDNKECVKLRRDDESEISDVENANGHHNRGYLKSSIFGLVVLNAYKQINAALGPAIEESVQPESPETEIADENKDQNNCADLLDMNSPEENLSIISTVFSDLNFNFEDKNGDVYKV